MSPDDIRKLWDPTNSDAEHATQGAGDADKTEYEMGDKSGAIRVRCLSTKGPFELEIYPKWAPIGAARFIDLVQSGFFTDHPMIRTVENFLVQFGVHGDPAVQRRWNAKGNLKDDPNLKIPFRKGFLSFAGGGANTRTTSVFIGYSTDPGQLNAWGKSPWETPFGRVVKGMKSVDAFYKGYGDFKGIGGNTKGVDWDQMNMRGNAYIKPNFPLLDFIRKCDIIDGVTKPSFDTRLPVGTETGEGNSARSSSVTACAYDRGHDYFAYDLSGPPLPADTPEECCQHCRKRKGCRAWGWNDGSCANCAQYKHKCWLKRQAGMRVANPAVVSGLLCGAKHPSDTVAHAKKILADGCKAASTVGTPNQVAASTHTRVHCSTSKGHLEIEVRPDWSPLGAARFLRLVRAGFFTNNVFYRVPPLASNPIAQFGVAWKKSTRTLVDSWGPIKDDHPQPWVPQEKGYIGFGGGGPDTRTYHMWLARKNFAAVHPSLGKNSWDTPVARVTSGLSVLDRIEQVGDMAPWGHGPESGKIWADSTVESSFPGEYLKKKFPRIDFFNFCNVISDDKSSKVRQVDINVKTTAVLIKRQLQPGLEITYLSGPSLCTRARRTTCKDTLKVHYTGKLSNGKVFDSSRKPGRSAFGFTLCAGDVIKGWDRGLQGLCEHQKVRLTIASPLAYGDRGFPGSIPPKSTLHFDIEVIAIRKE